MEKISIFPQSDELLNRRRIFSALSEGLNYPIVSVTAGSGYGKTQALSSFISTIEGSVIWISFSTLDNHPSHFWKNFCNSFYKCNPSLSLKMDTMGFPEKIASLHSFMKLLSNHAYNEKQLIMVWDDCHNITEPSVMNFLQSIVYASIENMTIFMLSRSTTFFHQVSKNHHFDYQTITETTLAFTLDEIKEYFQQQHIIIPFSAILTLFKKTEGWPTGIYFAMLSLKEMGEYYNISYDFTSQFIYQMIQERLFSRYSKKNQEQLIGLSLLPFLSIYLIEEIADDTNYLLEETGLLVRYNQHTNAYQFHQLFLDFLIQQQGQLTEIYKTRILKIAGKWYLDNQFYIDALNCYQQLNDYQKLWEIAEILLPLPPSPETCFLLLDIFDSFPIQFIETHPMYGILYSNLCSRTTQFEKAKQILLKTIADFKEHSDEKYHRFAGEALIYYGLILMLDGDIDFQSYFQTAMRYLPERSRYFTKESSILLNGDSITLCYGNTKEMEDWVTALENVRYEMEFLLNGSTCGLHLLAKAQAFYYQGDLKEAEKYTLKAILIGMENQCVDIVGNSYFLLSKIYLSTKSCHDVLKCLDNGRKYVKEHPHHSHYNMPAIADSYFYVRVGQVDKISEWILNDTLYNKFMPLDNYGLERLVKADFLFEQENYEELLQYLVDLEQACLKSNRYIALVYIHILKAIACHYLTEKQQAYQELSIAYEMTWKNGIITPFVEYGRFMRSLINSARKQPDNSIPIEWLNQIYTKSSTYAKKLNNIYRQYYQANHPKAAPFSLSKREQEVLLNLSYGLSREEIASQMQISTNTVKSLLKDVYSKLGAINGYHAVRIATIYGMIE